jgi:GAG-pre-integrase domain
MGDLHIELLNGLCKTKVTFKNAIHAPGMAFTLISISRLDKAGYSVLFSKGMCAIQDLKGQMIATIPHSNGLYKLVANQSKKTETANTASTKMSINEAHRKLDHIAHSAVKHAITKGITTGIELDLDFKVEFCKDCAKAKLARQPFPKESEMRAEKFGGRVHWDLWGLGSVKNLNGHHYIAARIDNATGQTKLYFQGKRRQTFTSYKIDESYIETQSGNHIKVCRSDKGRKFLSNQMISHQDQKGTKRELTIHNSPPQNGVSERGMQM